MQYRAGNFVELELSSFFLGLANKTTCTMKLCGSVLSRQVLETATQRDHQRQHQCRYRGLLKGALSRMSSHFLLDKTNFIIRTLQSLYKRRLSRNQLRLSAGTYDTTQCSMNLAASLYVVLFSVGQNCNRVVTSTNDVKLL